MLLNLASFLPWVVTFGLTVVLLGRNTQPDRGIGFAMLVSFAATGAQIVMDLTDGQTWWVSYIWPMLHGTCVIWALGGKYVSRAVLVSLIVIVSFLAAIEAAETTLVIRGTVGLAIVVALWRSGLLSSALGIGLGVYHVGALPGVLLMLDPATVAGGFVLARAAQLGGLLCLSVWTVRRPLSMPRSSSGRASSRRSSSGWRIGSMT